MRIELLHCLTKDVVYLLDEAIDNFRLPFDPNLQGACQFGSLIVATALLSRRVDSLLVGAQCRWPRGAHCWVEVETDIGMVIADPTARQFGWKRPCVTRQLYRYPKTDRFARWASSYRYQKPHAHRSYPGHYREQALDILRHVSLGDPVPIWDRFFELIPQMQEVG